MSNTLIAIGCIFAEFLIKRPLFPGKTEGSMLIEQMAILGLPTAEELKKMSRQIDQAKIDLVHKVDDMPKKKFIDILP